MFQRPLHSRLWYEFLRYLLHLMAVLVYRIRVTGRENIPATGGVLLVSNHQSHLDPPLVGIGCPRHVNYLARQSLFRFAPFGWLITSLGVIPLDQGKGGISGLKESLRRLKRGEILAIFPEGTRSRDGRIGRFMPGFTTLAVRSGAAILPAAIDGAYQAWPRQQAFPGGGRVRVHYGEPILPAEIAVLDERELSAEVERRVRECLTRCR